MEQPQAEAVIALLQSYFPVPELPPSSVATWSDALAEYSYEVGVAGAHRLGRGRVRRGIVELAELLAECDVVWREAWERAKTERRAEITDVVQGEFAELDDEKSRRVLADYFATVGGDAVARLRLTRAAQLGDTEAKIAAARQVALAQIEAESNPVAEGQAKPLRDSIPPHLRRSACGAEFGTPSVIRNGVAVCPNCSAPISEGCGGFAAEQKRERERA